MKIKNQESKIKKQKSNQLISHDLDNDAYNNLAD